MSFGFDAFFLIEPRPALAERLAGRTDPDLAALLMQPTLIRKKEVSGSEWPHADRLAQVKLLYLASIADYTPLDAPDEFESLLGSARFSGALFDRWWVVRRLEVDEDWEELEAMLRARLDRAEPTEKPRIDQWLSSLGGTD
jgi:hypothetical protein